MNTYILTEQQMRTATLDGLVDYTVGLQHTANTLIAHLEQISTLIDQAYQQMNTPA